MTVPYPATRRPALYLLSGLVITALVLLPLLTACDAACDAVCARVQPAAAAVEPRDSGYAVLRKLLGDEQHVNTLRIVKSAITFSKSSDRTIDLINDIATTSARGLDDLDALAALRPAINPETAGQERLGSEILDALRLATARELITATGEDFELSLVLSQVQVLRLISQLLGELQELDPNTRRQAWLADLAGNYEKLYGRAVARLSVK